MTVLERFADGSGWEEAAGYCRAVRRGPLVWVSGTTAHGPDGTSLHPENTYAQTRECLDRIDRALLALGAHRTDVVHTRVYLVPGADADAAGRAHREFFADGRPANTTLVVASLIGTGFLVEVEAQAMVDPATDRALR